MMKRFRKAQGVLEYTLFLAAIIAVIMVILFRTGGFQSAVNSTYSKVIGAMNKTANNATAGVFGM
jgi:Flp pilus assembly pilin Flp